MNIFFFFCVGVEVSHPLQYAGVYMHYKKEEVEEVDQVPVPLLPNTHAKNHRTERPAQGPQQHHAALQIP